MGSGGGDVVVVAPFTTGEALALRFGRGGGGGGARLEWCSCGDMGERGAIARALSGESGVRQLRTPLPFGFEHVELELLTPLLPPATPVQPLVCDELLLLFVSLPEEELEEEFALFRRLELLDEAAS